MRLRLIALATSLLWVTAAVAQNFTTGASDSLPPTWKSCAEQMRQRF
jgi:hypothetical protein